MGESKTKEPIFKLFYLLAVIVGSVTSLNSVMAFADMMILAMGFPNILGLIILSNEVKQDLNSYWARLKNDEIRTYK